MNKATVKDFFDAWSIYDRVLDLNYMFHDEIYRGIATLLMQRFAARPFSILDLGCGSAQHLAKALQGRMISRYLGYDLSETALGQARRNLAPLNCPMEFKQADFFEGIRAGDEKFSLIFSSYALHHLKSADKERFFQIARQRLTADGILLLIDIAREENEDRAEFLDHYCRWIQSKWNSLPQGALDLIFNHIRQSDFPEPDTAVHAMAERGGFVRGVNVARFLWHHVWRFDSDHTVD